MLCTVVIDDAPLSLPYIVNLAFKYEFEKVVFHWTWSCSKKTMRGYLSKWYGIAKSLTNQSPSWICQEYKGIGLQRCTLYVNLIRRKMLEGACCKTFVGPFQFTSPFLIPSLGHGPPFIHQ